MSEMVAIDKAVEERLGERRGNPLRKNECLTDFENYEGIVPDLAQLETGAKTRAIAAKKAGFRVNAAIVCYGFGGLSNVDTILGFVSTSFWKLPTMSLLFSQVSVASRFQLPAMQGVLGVSRQEFCQWR